MMVNKKIVLSLMLMIFGGMTSAVQACDVRNQLGQTELIDSVIKEEVQIATITSDINRLWHVCYQVVQIYDGQRLLMNPDGSFYFIPQYRSEVQKRPSCMDSDILALKDREADLSKYIAEVVAKITILATSGEQLNARDNDGKTVLDYCSTPSIHDALCSLGAEESMMVWAYFNPVTATVLAGFMLCSAVLGYMVAANAA